MRIEIKCKECDTVLRYEVKKYKEDQFNKFEVDYIVYPCQTCLDDQCALCVRFED